MANLKSGTLIGGNLIWNAGNLPVKATGDELYINSYEVYTEFHKPTASEVGAVNKVGDTMTGDLVVKSDSGVISQARDASSNAHFWLKHVDGKNAGLFYCDRSSNSIYLRKYDTAGTTTENQVVLNTSNTVILKDPQSGAVQGTAVSSLTRKDYVNAEDAKKLNLTGGILTGALAIIPSSGLPQLRLGSDKWYLENNATNSFGIVESGISSRLLIEKGGKSTFTGTLYEGVNRVYSAANKPTAADVGSYSKSESDGKYPLKAHTHTMSQIDDRGAQTPEFASILGATDLNALKTTDHAGFYYQNSNDSATPERNYPTALAGSLLVQIAVGLTQTYTTYSNPVVYTRSFYNNVWSVWGRVYSTISRPTSAEIGALSSGGGTITGILTSSKSSGTVISSTQPGFADFIGISETEGGAYIGKSGYYIRTGNASIEPRVVRNGTAYDIYHKGNKPTSADISALDTGFLSSKVVNDANNADTVGTSTNFLISTALNRPTGTDHSLLTLAHNQDDYANQQAQDWRTNKMYIRNKNSGAWGSWTEVYTRASKPTPSEVGALSIGANTVVNATGTGVGQGLAFNGRTVVGGVDDAWLRINPHGQFTSGVYSEVGTLRSDGNIQRGDYVSSENQSHIIRPATDSVFGSAGSAAYSYIQTDSVGAHWVLGSYKGVSGFDLRSGIQIRSNDTGAMRLYTNMGTKYVETVDGELFANGNKVYHTANKPTAADVRARTAVNGSFKVTGDSSKFYLVKFPLNNVGIEKIRIWREYSTSIGGVDPNWNDGSSTHFGSLSIDVVASGAALGGSQPSIDVKACQQYTNILGHVSVGDSGDHTLHVYLRASAGGASYVYDYGDRTSLPTVTVTTTTRDTPVNPYGVDTDGVVGFQSMITNQIYGKAYINGGEVLSGSVDFGTF